MGELRQWKKISSKLVYSNPWIKIYEDSVLRPDGNQGIYGFMKKKPANFIVALDNNDFMYLVVEYRYPIQKSVLQLPGGVIENDDILQQAKKELLEETGITAEKWDYFGGFYMAPGHETTFANIWLATNLNVSNLKSGGQEGDEAIQEIVKLSITEVKKKIVDNKIECGTTLAALCLFFTKWIPSNNV